MTSNVLRPMLPVDPRMAMFLAAAVMNEFQASLSNDRL